MTLVPGVIEVHIFDLAKTTGFALHPERSLSEDELSRGRSYKFQRDQGLFYARRMLLRKLLSGYTGIPPKEIQYQISPFGKLSLDAGAPSFSLATSQSQVAFAFSVSGPVGIDLEEVRPLANLPGLIQQTCSSQEKEVFNSLDKNLRLEAFFHIWTQKEAYLKACGAGFSIEPSLLTVEIDPRKPGRLIEIPGEDASSWQMVTMTPEPGWQLVVCHQKVKCTEVNFSIEDPAAYLVSHNGL